MNEHHKVAFVALALTLCGAIAVAGTDRAELASPLRLPAGIIESEDPGTGWLHAWDASVMVVGRRDGSGSLDVAWSTLDAKSSFEIARRLIDRQNAEHWVWLGLMMLEADERALAERAFGSARRLDGGLGGAIERALELHGAGENPGAAFEERVAPDAPSAEEQAAPERPRRGVRDGYAKEDASSDEPSRQWAPIDPGRIVELTERVKQICAALQDGAGVSLSLYETEHFLFYSDMSPGENRKWSGELDRMYQTLMRTLEIPEGTPMFLGKGPVFVFRERSDFIRFEQSAFGVNAARIAGVNHQRGGHTFTVFFKGSNEQEFNTVLIHETVHAFMYRYRSSYALPTWANEGLSDFIAGVLVAYSKFPQDNWQHSRNFIAKGGDPHEIMGQTYRNGRWFDENSYPVSHMLVRFMLKHKPRAFKLWIDDVKAGQAWEQALEARFNVTPERLADGFARDIMSERGYSRIK